MKLDILAFGAHPDDVELGCGGSVLKAVNQGYKVGIIDLTQGELGTRGSAEIRAKEAQKAAELLGVIVRENLNFRDGFFTNDETHQLAVIRVLRKYRPNVVLCNAIDDRHIDHGKGGRLVSDACFLSGLSKIQTHDLDHPQMAWRPKQVYHYIQWKDISPDIVVDISHYLDQKVEVIKAYASQFYDPASDAPSTPISSKNFLDSVAYRAQNLGRLGGVSAGEGFTVERTPIVEDFFDLK